MKATICCKASVLKAVRTLVLYLVVTLLTTSGTMALPPAAAAAEGGPNNIVLAFGDRYGSPERQHLGCDVSGEAGENVHSPVAGTVTFAGWVPREPSGRVRAVTIEAADGSLVTVSPLDSTEVSRGDLVEVGCPLGGVAPDGDASSVGPHIHLSMRIDGKYVDPSHLVGFLFLAAEPGPKTGGSPEGEQPPAFSTTPRQTAVYGSELAAKTAAAQGAVQASAQQLGTAPLAREAGAVSYPLATLAPKVPLQVARAASLDRRFVAGGLLSSSVAGGVFEVTSRAVSGGAQLGLGQKQLFALALGLLGIGSVAGVSLHRVMVGTSKITPASKRLAEVFAVRGNRW